MARKFASGFAAAAALCASLPAWAQGSDDQAKQMVDTQCNSCHPIGARTGSGYTLDGWKTVMRMMTNEVTLVKIVK